ncbi:hypothetical protein C0Q70_18169 [Pomacea canaliculata]|uniref:Fucosyltransferase n=1 Tax=Pomacea canaliculata TaxID=400727 RepID=A0A2T7NMG3_POMCA|nr:hypothetical protein C0Q70_18169 [Pomacea canaliculata]
MKVIVFQMSRVSCLVSRVENPPQVDTEITRRLSGNMIGKNTLENRQACLSYLDNTMDGSGRPGMQPDEHYYTSDYYHYNITNISSSGASKPARKEGGSGRSGGMGRGRICGEGLALVGSKNFYQSPIPESPFHPNHSIRWEFDTTELLKRPDVMNQPPKIITWVKKPRHIPDLPEPVRLRVCPEMPCRVTSNTSFQEQSSALLWAGELMTETEPPRRSHPDQVFVFHDLEPPRSSWVCSSTFRLDPWKSAFNWTMHYRFDADILSLHGLVVKRRRPVKRNYTDILARKTKFAAWAVSSVIDQSRRKEFAAMLQKYISIDIFGESSAHRCPRDQDDLCFQTFSRDYKFYLGFESSLAKDYISEKFFRYLNLDTVLVARGSNEYKFHAPQNIFINTADFATVKDLADYLLHLDKHPEEYLEILKAKDEYEVLFEDYPLRYGDGQVFFMHYQYEATAFCEMCRRLWNLDSYRQTIPDIRKWVDKELCYEATDLH